MVVLNTLSAVLGYFMIMIIFMILAIIKARRKSTWVYFFSGAVLQLIALIEDQKSGTLTGTVWMAYIILLLVFAVLIILVQKKANNVNRSKKRQLKDSDTNQE